MEYLPNGHLRKWLKKAAINDAVLLKQFVRICQCVNYCHDKDITHRDIKPENILFRTEHQPVLSDFGLCKFEGLRLGTEASEMIAKGTPSYMAPEQRRELLDQSRPADIFALGTMLHFDIGSRIANGELKQRVNVIAERCTRNEPVRRPKIKALITQIERLVDSIEEQLQQRGK